MWFNLLILYVVLALSLHSLVAKSIKAATVFSKFLVIGTIVGLALLAHLYSLWGISLELFAGALTYAFICELYIFIFTAISTCVSVSIILKVAVGKVKMSDLAADYCGKTMVENRLRRLQKIGLLQPHNNQLCLTKSGEQLVRRFHTLREFFKLDPNESPKYIDQKIGENNAAH